MQITDTDRIAIRGVIESQLEAFQIDDAITAFSFATPGIQATFQSPEMFMEMVTTHYQAVYRPRAVVFDDLAIVNGYLSQPVLLLDPDGVPMRALYVMENQPNGSWRIHGCYLVPVEGQTIP
ncbi:DUF4864 domain-containing protein [Argonema antarcticum]|uniref:DUF4864 domain-containing protein n=1 Tax=Argonema antarcticum TaxID=2942763 RepID=UPI0020124CD6|nr:DUF4864 domain-containing protein [Argonema antarcticum]MCL1475801.1 DUF4864 domain-containing protein [Argonema antarcticum A004/B2]